MTLTEYVNQQMQTTGKTSRRAILEPLSVKAGVSFTTLSNVDRGARITRYDVAKAIEGATRGAVTVRELCEQ